MKALITLLLSIFLTFPAIAFSHAASLSPGPDAQQRINDSASGKDPASLQAISGSTVSLPSRGLGLLQSIDGLMSSGRIASAGRKNFPEALAPSLPPLSAQPSFGSNSVTQEFGFIRYLFDNNLRSDALTLLNAPYFSDSDTLSYLRGKAFFESRRLYDASAQFARVPYSSAFFEAARFHDLTARLYVGDYSGAAALLDDCKGCREDLLSLDRAALSLLAGDFSSFPEAIVPAKSSTLPQIRDAADELTAVSEAMQAFRPRSPLLLAGASALVPGLGKMLSGRVGEGVSALLAVASLAAVTAENAVHCGISDWKTILFGSMTLLSYTANIYGSYLSARIYNQKTILGYETAVVVSVRLPLLELFR